MVSSAQSTRELPSEGTSIALNTDVFVAQNEPIISHVINRNAKKLLENDLMLYELYKKVFGQLLVSDYSPSAVYQNGDFVWLVENGRLYLLKCIVDNNSLRPNIKLSNSQPVDALLKMSGWENKNKYLTIFDYGIEGFLNQLVAIQLSKHEDSSYHPFGKVSLDSSSEHYLGKSLLYKDMHNIDESRKTVFFPQHVQKLDAGIAVLNGYMRNYGKVLEYDIIVKLASSDIVDVANVFSSGASLSANTLKLSMSNGLTKNSVSYQDNLDYFYNSAAMDIFSPSLSASQIYESKIGLTIQANRNDYVNTYAAKVVFPKPFKDRKYMVFSNSMLSYTNGTDVGDGRMAVVPSTNDIAVCDKTRDSITLLDIAFPSQSSFADVGYSAKNGGLVANSFHCKVIGEIGE